MRKFALLITCMVLCSWHVVFAQSRTVSGTVTNADDGSTMPGVSVVLKGTSIGTVTGIDGEYSLSIPDDGETLIFSFVGMKNLEVPISGSVLNVGMEPETIGVDEVVVTAMGIKRPKGSLTYQTAQVESEDLVSAASTEATDGLIGKIAGLQINAQTNGVNPSRQILLRGLRSISANNEALIVIDGSVATSGAFNDLNPNDIESINVLKGATAAALYGSSAANGALIVETKAGRVGTKMTIGVNHSTTFESVAFMPDFQDKFGSGWDGEYNNIENTNWGPRFDGQLRQIGPTMPDDYVLETQMVPYAPIQDNLKNFYNTGLTMQNTAYLTGGDENSSFYMSLGNQTAEGIIPDDSYEKISARVNATKKLGSVELSVNSSFMTDNTDVVGSSIGDQDRQFYWFLLNTPQNIPLASYSDWDNPASYGYADNYFNAFYQNPYWAIGTNRNIDKSSRFNANMAASWDISSNINWTTRIATNSSWGYGKNWRARQEYDAGLQPYHSTVSSFVVDSEYQSSINTGNTVLTGNFDITEDISLNAIVGANIYIRDWRNSWIQANNLSIPGFYDISNGTGQLSASVDQLQKRTMGVFGDFTFGFRDWAYLTLTGRQDYTSTLSADNNSYFYPAIGLSVILTEAVPSLKDNDVLSYAKLTLNNSTVYNDLDPYQINERYSQSAAFPFGTLNGFAKTNVAVDENIKKEKLNTTEVGLNLSFFDSRVNLDASYYYTETTDLITYTTPSFAAGATSYLTNIGSLHGSGVELSLGARVLNVGDFKWDLNVNYATQTTVVDEIVGDLKEVALDSYSGYGTFAVVDHAFPQLKAVGYVRDQQGRVVVDGASGDPLVGEIQNMGRTTPKHIIGLNTQLRFKGFTFSTTLDYRTGHVYFAQGQMMMEFTGRSPESVAANRKDFVWPNSVIEQADGSYVENTNITISEGRMTFWQNRYNEIMENYVKDATTLKIREMSLKYDLPKSIVDRQDVFQKITVGAVARNLYTWLPQDQSNFSDPEFRNVRGTDDPNGIGIGGYLTGPPTRSLGFNVIVEF